MFWKPKSNVIESDEGFVVESTGRTGLKYTEKGRSLFIDSQALLGSPALVIYQRSIRKWDPPYADQIIDHVERQRIVNNVRAAYLSQGVEIDVE